MPFLLLIPLAGAGLWFVNKQVQESEGLIVKGLVIAGVAYVAYYNRASIAKAFK